MKHITIPADVPQEQQKKFITNYNAITKQTNHLFLFACDQAIEHLMPLPTNFKPSAHKDVQDPEHLFKIASQGTIGAMATHSGLIARYGKQYPSIPYIAKLNSKTNLIPADMHDPISAELWDVHDTVQLAEESSLNIAGIGVTVYPGSKHENAMMEFASNMILEAHNHGLIAIVWMYPRGAAIENDRDPKLLIGAAKAANALGADFVKIKSPLTNIAQNLQAIVNSAGNTNVLCSGGARINPIAYLENVYAQLHEGGVSGIATGRNIIEQDLKNAVCMTNALAAIVYENASLEKAIKHLK